MLKVEVLHEPFPSEKLVSEWRELLGEASFATPFQTPEWMGAWLRHFGGSKKPFWITVREGDDLVGFFGLYQASGVMRTVRAIGTGQSDYLHPLLRRGVETEASRAILDHLLSLRDVDLIDLQQMRETVPFDDVNGDSIEQACCLALDLPNTYETYLQSLGKSLRYDCRRADKPPFKDGDARLRTASANETAATLAAFFRLHTMRWRKRGLPGSFATRQLKKFHIDVASELAEAGHLRLTVMETGGESVGVLYGMQIGGTRFFYQCGFDPEYKALSPGTLLVATAIKDSIEEGCTRFDFLRGDEAYKRRWNPQHSFRNMRYILPLNSGLGSVGRAISHAGSKIEEKIRARLEGRGLLR